MATIAGIGFTVSIFVAGLAFDDPALTDQAKIGVLAASVVAAGGGAALLSSRPRREGDGSED
jgi:NhaA family Na+:H+ antiporter